MTSYDFLRLPLTSEDLRFVCSVAFAAAGLIAMGSDDKTAKTWSTDGADELRAANVAACLAACMAPVLRSAEPTARAAQRAHLLFVSGTVTWCQVCGAYGHSRLRGLLRSCPGTIAGRSESGRAAALRLLRNGRHPKSLAPLPRAVPLR